MNGLKGLECADLRKDGKCFRFRGLRAGDLSAHNKVRCSIDEGLGWRGDAFLVPRVLSGGTNAWGNQDFLRAGKSPDGLNFQWGADETVNSRTNSLLDPFTHQIGGAGPSRIADFEQVGIAKAGEDRNAQNPHRGIALSFNSCGHHLRVGMDSEEIDAEAGRSVDGSLDGFRDVVEFEIQKHFLAETEDLPDDGGAFGGVEFHADLVEVDRVAELVDELEGLLAVFDIEGNDDGVVA